MSDNVGENVFWIPPIAGLVTLLALPAALLVSAWRPAWIDRTADALVRQRTAVVLAGAGLFIAEFFAFVLLWNAPALRILASAVLLVAAAQFVVGFAGGATAQGRAMLGRERGVSVLILGWIARSLAFAVPLLNLVIGAYLVAAALGAPVVALVTRSKSATEPSDGSTPAS